MDRARRAALAALFLVVAVGIVLAGGDARRRPALHPAAVVAWPASTLVISEIQTGGASASDEIVELANAGSSSVNLAGFEVVYVTATGGTITRKASWASPQLLDPGRHLLIANSLGIHAASADLTYSGGLAATGGSIVLRPIGGTPTDAVGWGDAVNAFVEGSPAPAPPAGSSIERRPGGLDGNGTDTNSNLGDLFVQASPNPQTLAAPPVVVPTPTPSATIPAATTPPATLTPAPTVGASAVPTASAAPSASPSASPSAETTAAPSAAPSVDPSPDPTVAPSATPGEPSATPSDPASSPPVTPSPAPSDAPSPTTAPSPTAGPSATPSDPGTSPVPSPTPAPTAEPTPPPSPPVPTASPTPAPSATPVPSPSPTAAPSVTPNPTPIAISIEVARLLQDGATATIRGVLTTALGALEDGRMAFVQDATAGIAVYLDAASVAPLPAGTIVSVTGTLDERYSARILRAEAAAVVPEGLGTVPAPSAALSGAIGEGLEGRRVVVTGTTVGSPTAFADGTGLLVDDGSGSARAIVSPDALEGRSVPAGTRVTVIGPVGQRDSTGTGTTGYRVHATLDGELVVLPTPTPSPSTPPPTAAPSAPPSAVPTTAPSGSTTTSPSAAPTVAPTAAPSASLQPGPTPMPIADARRLPVGTSVTVAGVVTAENGRLGTPALLAVQDAGAGIVVRLVDGMVPPPRSTIVELSGALAAPYGQLELRLAPDGLRIRGTGTVPAAMTVAAIDVAEAAEARLVSVTGSVAATPWKSTAHDIAFDLVDAAGDRVRVMADASSGLSAASVRAGSSYRLTGVVGQRASKKDAPDGYRVWLRDARDLAPVAAPAAASTSATVLPIRLALAMPDATVAIEGTVTAPAQLLDATLRRTVVEDSGAAIEVLMPVGMPAPPLGASVRIQGLVGRAYGAPRLRAAAVERLVARSAATPRTLDRAPGEGEEWQLVRIAGTVGKVTRLGTRWRAEIDAGGRHVLVDGLPGAEIPSTTLATGRSVTVTGIVKRAYPGAADQRYSVVPRTPDDIAFTGAGGGGSRATAASGAGAPVGAPGANTPEAPSPSAADVDLGALGEHEGEVVRVGGLVVEPTAAGFRLDDGTAVAAVILGEGAADYLGLLEPGDAVNAVGQVVADDADPGTWVILVTSPGSLLRIGDLGQPLAVGPPIEGAAASPEAPGASLPAARDARRLGLESLLPEGVSGPAAIVSLALMSSLSLASALLRRRRARLEAARIEGRIRRYVQSRSEKP